MEIASKPRVGSSYLLFSALLALALIPDINMTALASLDLAGKLAWVLDWHWIAALVVSAPFWLALIASASIRKRSDRVKREFALELDALTNSAPNQGRDADAERRDAARWQHAKNAAETTWSYERSRYLKALQRLEVNILVFGNLVVFVLVMCALVLRRQIWIPSGVHFQRFVVPLVFSIAAAAATAFLIRFVRALVRISVNEVSCRMFAWATQAIGLVVVADIGLFLLFDKQVETIQGALLLGIFAGATGDHALDIMLEKAAVLFKASAPATRGPSPLLFLEGMTPEHVARLEEEGITSIHDLAFVPTARLFFGTAYSLQQICDWQDRALLHVYVGSEGVKGLTVRLKIVGAIDLMFCCKSILPDLLSGQNGQQSLKVERKEQLRLALGLELGGLLQLAESMEHDEVTMRLRMYWQSAVNDTVKEDQGQPDESETKKSRGAAPVKNAVS